MKIFLLVLEVIVAILLVGVIVLQPSEESSLGNIRSGDFLSSRRGSNLLTRITAVLATIFFILCLGLGILSHRSVHQTSIDKIPIPQKTATEPHVDLR